MAITVLPSDTLMACLKEHAHELGGQGINLFSNAVGGTKSKLLDYYIRPHLLRPGQSYIYIAEDNGKTGRKNFDPCNTAAAMINSELAVPGRWGLFANPLAWIDINASGPRPSDRPINIGFCVYTLEFDNLAIGEQLKAISNGGLKRTEDILTCFKDYRGYEVVYGGRKSLHFHFVFDLRHWSHDLAFASNSTYQENWLADFPDTYLREAHEDRWGVITDAFRMGTGIEAELFSELAALDARLGTRNSIALWYVDRFNQTCGRNRGFRGQYDRRHIAVMTHRMYKWLAPYLFGWSRYAFPRQRCSVELGKIV